MDRSRTTIIFRTLVALAAVCPWAVTVGAGRNTLSSHVIEGGVTIDGDLAEWESVPIRYVPESIRTFSVAQDEDALYLTWSFGDSRLAEVLLRTGVVVWLDGDGKKNRRFGVRYGGSPAVAEAIAEAQPRDSSGDPSPGERTFRQRPGGSGRGPGGLFRSRVTPGVLTVIDGEDTYKVAEPRAGSPWAAAAVHDGVYCYELRIPVNLIGGKLVEKTASDNRNLRLGFEIGGMTEQERDELKAMMRERRASMGISMGGGGRGGGGMGGGGAGRGGMGGGATGGRGGGGARRSPMDRMLEDKTVWFKVEMVATAAGSS